jgi:PPE-repeat protein
MTAPVWMAAPPEVHSALLSSGPGPASLLAAAGAWNSLSEEYTSVAEELSAVLAQVQSGAWQGPSAEQFVAAFVPYLAWLTQESANSAAAAAQHETTAAAYTAALAAMPTLPELATNHVIHGVLTATNFFGINTIPIALNEADYVRMWVQAAATMGTYQTVSSAALASTPTTTAAPPIVKTEAAASDSSIYDQLSGDNPLGIPQWLQNILKQFGISNTLTAHDPKLDYFFDNWVADFLQNFGVTWDPAAGTVNGATYDSYANPAVAMFWVARALELFEDVQQFGTYLVTNPVEAFQYFFSWELFDFPIHIEEVLIYLVQNPLLLAVVASPALAPGALGAVGLTGLAAIPPPPAGAPVPVVAPPPILPVAGSAPTVTGATGAISPGTAPAPSAGTAASPASGAPPPPSPPPAGAGPGFAPPYIVGGPTIGAGMSLQTKTHEPTSRGASKAPAAAAAVAAAALGKTRKRRRRRAEMRDHADEYADMNIDVDPDWGAPTASDRGAGPLGFSGTLTKGSEQATGLATLSDDGFGSGPSMPMLPNTWTPEPPNGDGHDN